MSTISLDLSMTVSASQAPRRLPIYPGIVLCAACLCLTGHTRGIVDAAEKLDWSSSLGAASLGTSQDEKPLLVIDLAGDVTAEPFTSPMGRLLEATTLSDPRIIKLSRGRFKVVCRQHGATPLVKRHVPRREKALADVGRADNVVFYFCTPDARVLHMATGFLPADELLAAAALAERLLRETQLQDEVAGQMQVVRGWHVTCADGKNLLDFQRRCALKGEKKPASFGGWNSPHVRRIITAAAQVHEQELKLRFANHWRGVALDQTVASLGHHGEVATSFSHLVLSEVPLVPLDTLDRICFEAVTGQPCLSITARRKALQGWFVTSRRQRQPIMFVVDDQPFAAPPVNELAELLVWQPRNSEVRQKLTSLAGVQVTPGELAALVQDVGLPPVTLSRNPKNWLLFDREGVYVDVVVSENGPRLLEAMELASK